MRENVGHATSRMLLLSQQFPQSFVGGVGALEMNVKKYPGKPMSPYGFTNSDPLCSGICSNPRFKRPPVLVISLDGFAYEYIERNVVKTFNRFKKCGTSAEWMYSSYPSKTFPNHYTMVTGLYPEAHGIIDNNIYDPSIAAYLVDVRRKSDSRYYKGEPIWVTAAKHNLKTACLFWAGCSIDFNAVGMVAIAGTFKALVIVGIF
ncbi:unnamed protein product [Gongylonema pulchrum]|uniref:AP3A hydrolase n=1 Tax=Gongylonema pulchrum TaxID=637853 RepID=A0A3P6PQS2_9BILA|nr:unnamed protein product [Gongylonema pulchrum]